MYNMDVIYTIEEIKSKTERIFKNYNIEKAYLFGSYARGEANEDSDIDIMVKGTLRGFTIGGLFEDLKQALNKNIDLLREETYLRNKEKFINNQDELNKEKLYFWENILKERILIYEKK